MGIVDGRYDRNWMVRDVSKRTSDRPRGTHVCIYLFMRSNIGIYLFRHLPASAPSCRRAFLSFPARGRGSGTRDLIGDIYRNTRPGSQLYKILHFIVGRLYSCAKCGIMRRVKYFPTRCIRLAGSRAPNYSIRSGRRAFAYRRA
jgi:hypothetical protein